MSMLHYDDIFHKLYIKCYVWIRLCNIFVLWTYQVCRLLNEFVQNVAMQNVSNKNVELGGKNGFKLFYNGIAHWIRKQISVDGGFHIAMARQMNVFLCNMELLPMEMKKNLGVHTRCYSEFTLIYACLYGNYIFPNTKTRSTPY